MVNAEEARKKRYQSYLKAELDAAAMYSVLADMEGDERRAQVFRRLVQAEMRHASRWAEKLGMDVSKLRPSPPGPKLLLVRLMTRSLGLKRVMPLLLRGEANDVNAYASDPEARDLAMEERHHARLLRAMVDRGVDNDPLAAVRAENTSLISNGGGSLRAAVLGVNDGLVSNFSLVMGVAGGSSDPQIVLLAGVAGLMAGAFSMAAGEYISMRSQRDIFEHQIRREKVELEAWPEEEEEELVLIYQSKGLSSEEARNVARRVMANPDAALDTMAREELGLDPSQLGSPWGAAFSSFAAFTGGAIVPILPYVFGAGGLAFFLSALLSAVALVLVGGTLAFLAGRNPLWGATRMLLAGGLAAGVTYGVGRLVGVSVMG